MIDSFSYGESCDVWEFDYFCWEFSRLGRVQGEFESAYTIFLASCGRKFTQTLFSDSFTGINPENCLTLIRIFYNYFLTDNPDLHAVYLMNRYFLHVLHQRATCSAPAHSLLFFLSHSTTDLLQDSSANGDPTLCTELCSCISVLLQMSQYCFLCLTLLLLLIE